jgi:hypothetical protein
VHERAGDGRQRTDLGTAVPLEHPPQRAPQDLLDVRGGDGHDLAGRAKRGLRGHPREAVPVVGRGTRNSRPGQASQLHRRPATACVARRAPFRALAGLVRTAHGPPQLTDQFREHQGATGPVHGAVRPVATVVRGRVQLVEEPRWLLPAGQRGAVRLHRAHQQRLPGARARDVEQPPLLGEQRRDPRHRGGGLGHPGDEIDQPLAAQETSP